MKIVFVTTNYPRWKGDNRAPFIHGLAQALINRGHSVRVITMHNPGSSLLEIMEGVEVIRIAYAPVKYETLQATAAGIPIEWKKSLWSKILLFIFFLRLAYKLPRLLKGFQLIHAHWTLSGMAVRITRLFHRLPYVVTVHGSDVYQALRPVLRMANLYSLYGANFVICVGKNLASEAVKLGVKAEKVRILTMGVNVSDFQTRSFQQREDQVLYVGSLIKRKSVDTLIDAFSKVPIKYKLVVVGEGPEKDNLIKLSMERQVLKRTTFMGSVSPSIVSQLNSQSKVFVLPSLEEGLGVVLLEALASGTPCIASCVGGIPDVVDDSVGILVPPGDSEAIAFAIEDLLSNPKRWQKLSSAARKRIESTYDWSIIATKTIDIYKLTLDSLSSKGFGYDQL